MGALFNVKSMIYESFVGCCWPEIEAQCMCTRAEARPLTGDQQPKSAQSKVILQSLNAEKCASNKAAFSTASTRELASCFYFGTFVNDEYSTLQNLLDRTFRCHITLLGLIKVSIAYQWLDTLQ